MADEWKELHQVQLQLPQILDGKAQPGHGDPEQHIQVPQLPIFLQEFAQAQALHQDQQIDEHGPEQEVPAYAVPDPRQHPDHQQIEHRAEPALTVSPQGDVDILPKPAAQGYVPSAPEIAHSPGLVGIMEIIRQMEAQDKPQTLGHQRISVKIAVDLYGVGHQPHPGQGTGNAEKSDGVHLIPQGPHPIGDEHLQSQSDGKFPKPFLHLRHGVLPLLQLRSHLGIGDDGPCDQLGKHTQIGAQVHQRDYRN